MIRRVKRALAGWCVGVALISVAGAGRAGEGLFDGVLGEVGAGDERKAWAREAVREAFEAHARSLFTAEVGKPSSKQSTVSRQGTIRVDVPVTVRLNEEAYGALCRTLKERLEDPQRLNLKPMQVSQELRGGRPGEALSSHMVGGNVYRVVNRNDSGHMIAIIHKVDVTRKRAEVELYPVDEAVCEGLRERAPVVMERIRIDLLDENGALITYQDRNGKPQEASSALENGSFKVQDHLGHNRCGYKGVNFPCVVYKPGDTWSSMKTGTNDIETPLDFPVLGVVPVTFELPEDVLRRSRSFGCEIVHSGELSSARPVGGVRRGGREGSRARPAKPHSPDLAVDGEEDEPAGTGRGRRAAPLGMPSGLGIDPETLDEPSAGRGRGTRGGATRESPRRVMGGRR